MKNFVMMWVSIVSMGVLFIFASLIRSMDWIAVIIFTIAFICNFMGIITNVIKVVELLDKAEKK
jgi:hypothetical protein